MSLAGCRMAMKVIAYWNWQLKKAEWNYSTIEHEALAVVGSVKEFYPYLYGFQFKLLTDHNPLTSLNELKDVGGRLVRWQLYLQHFNFQYEYKCGASNSNANAFSRIPPAPENSLTTTDEISLANPKECTNQWLRSCCPEATYWMMDCSSWVPSQSEKVFY